MTDQVMVAVIGLAGVVTTAIATVLVAMIAHQRRELKAVKDQVTNSHMLPDGQPYNLRDNIDHNQEALLAELRGLRRDLGRVDQRTIDLGVEARDLRVKVDKHLDWSAQWSDERERADRDADARLTGIEQTLNPRKEQ